MAKIKRTPKAKQDLLEHVLYLAKINLDIAERFIDSDLAPFSLRGCQRDKKMKKRA
jgi:plasmid stabilization system protein ParE